MHFGSESASRRTLHSRSDHLTSEEQEEPHRVSASADEWDLTVCRPPHARMALFVKPETILEVALPQTHELFDTCRRYMAAAIRSEEHTSELQSLAYLVCRLLLEKK